MTEAVAALTVQEEDSSSGYFILLSCVSIILRLPSIPTRTQGPMCPHKDTGPGPHKGTGRGPHKDTGPGPHKDKDTMCRHHHHYTGDDIEILEIKEDDELSELRQKKETLLVSLEQKEVNYSYLKNGQITIL